jgi:hypothetical protein
MSVLTQAQCDSEDGNAQAWNPQGKFFGYKCEKIKFQKDERRKIDIQTIPTPFLRKACKVC